MKVIVRPHATKRLRERFRLHFHPDVFKDGRDKLKIKQMLADSVQCDFALKQRPGDYNAVCIHYGYRVNYFRYKDIAVLVTMTNTDGNTVVLTVCRAGMLVRSIKM